MAHQKAFTLIELMIVVVIIGILAAIAIPKYSDVSETTRRNACRANMRTISSQETIYIASHETYTTNLVSLEMDGVVCPASVEYLIEVPVPEEMNILCQTGHGRIINGVASWVNSDI